MEHLSTRSDRGPVDRVHLGPAGGAEGKVQFPGLRGGAPAQPEAGHAVAAGQPHHEGAVVRKADRLERTQVEGQGRLDVSHLDANVIDHGPNGTGTIRQPGPHPLRCVEHLNHCRSAEVDREASTQRVTSVRMNRWVILAGYALLAASTQLLWLAYAPITTQTHKI